MPKNHIEDIKNRYLRSDKEFVLASLNRSIDRIEKAFPRYGSFLMEFIQNADDAHSTSILIEIIEKGIRVFNNGESFSKENVDSICRVGISSKTPKDYIGYLGIGFKSVFLISASPEIYSGVYNFKFSKDESSDPDFTPWQVIPLWIERPSIPLPPDYATAFNIPLKESTILKKLQEETTPEHISNRMLLFLRNLTKIEIRDNILKTKRVIRKTDRPKTPDYEINRIEEYHGEELNGELKSQEDWLVFRSICDVPANVKEDHATKEWERNEIDKREVIVAFKLNEKESLIREEKGTAYVGVFSFKPLKEVESGLHFLVQADFLTTPGRGELARDCLWNEWLSKETYKLITEKCIPIFIKDDRWRKNFTEILHSPWGGHELFENNIKRPLREYLETMPCLIGEDELPLKADGALIVNTDIKELPISDDDLKALYPDKKVLAIDCKIAPDIERRVKKGPTYTARSSADYEMQRLIKHKAEKRDIAFFKKFYYGLSKYAESTLRNSSFRYQDILLTDTWELIGTQTAYIKPHALLIPIEIKENFRVIHPDLSADTTILQFLKILGVEELTLEHVQNILKTKEIPAIVKNWATFPDDEKVEKIKLYKTLWKDRRIDLRDLTFLTVKTKTGKWLKPEEMVFPKEYGPEQQIEVLLGKGLFDLPIEFVTPKFIENKSDEEIKEWYRFLKELGVDKKLEDGNTVKSIVQRIGILLALKFEESKGRKAEELPRSKEIGGYDIVLSQEESEESEEDGYGQMRSEERYIEVKSSKKPTPDIFLSAKQVSTLKDKLEKYFVYVVKDALRYPTLCVTRGDKLVNISETKAKIIIPFNKWWSSAKDEEFQP